jgi:4-oxalocrotonate tautomerase family enzyme
MPVIIVEGPALPDMEKKRALAKALTDAAVEAYGLPESAMVVVVHDNPLENVATAGCLVCDRGASSSIEEEGRPGGPVA